MRLALGSIALALAACASAPSNPGLRVEAVPFPPLPEGGRILREHGSFTGARGVPIFYQSWRAEGEPRGVLVIHHGLADHSDRYAPFAIALADAGYAVWAMDMRGHGRSGGERLRFDAIDDNLDDLDAFLAHVRAQEPGRPLFVWGHSVGGLIVTLHAIERMPEVAGVIAAAPAIAVEAPLLEIGAIQIFAVLAPGLPVLATPHGDFSADPEVNRALGRDPLIFQGKGAARSARAIVDGIHRVWRAPERLRAPLLALHGTGDKLTAPSGSRDLIARAGTADRTLRIYPGFAHDLVHQPDGGAAQVTADVRAWLDAHTGGPAWDAPAPPGGPYRGDAWARMIAVETDTRVELPTGDTDGADPAVTAGVRMRLGAGRATPLGLGWHGGLDLRGGYVEGWRGELDLHAVGFALRCDCGDVLSVTTGLGAGGALGFGSLRVPVEVSLEAALGPVRLLLRGAVAWRVRDDYPNGDRRFDERSAQLGVRLGRDRRYFGPVVAGAGPFLAFTYNDLGGAELVGVSLGLQLWGGR